MNKKIMKFSMLILCIVDIYIISFFFVFHRVCVTTEIVGNERPRTGPVGISIVVPHGNENLKKPLYYFYYPVHSFLQTKRWLHPIINTDIFEDRDEKNH
jgi:hypothetical protein